jgi:hypothetical protein
MYIKLKTGEVIHTDRIFPDSCINGIITWAIPTQYEGKYSAKLEEVESITDIKPS